MRVWNVATFFNERDVLEIRLGTLAPLVDVFVLAEANTTQRGTPKDWVLTPEVLDELRDRFPGVEIRLVQVNDMPEGPDHWGRENFQRNCLIRGMGDLADNDLVLISDMDEIPYPAALEEGLAQPGMRYGMDMHVYRLHWRWTQRPVTDGSTAVVRRGDYFPGRTVHGALLDPEGAFWRLDPASQLVCSSGWHLAYQYDQPGIRAKVQAIADNAWSQLVPQERKTDPTFWGWDETAGTMLPTDAWLDRCVREGVDVYGRGFRNAERVGLDQLPPYVAEHAARFAHLLVA